MVEAVPALTKVVLDTCSSSESDSCDEDDDLTHKKTKKQTLSSGHAREVDKKTDDCVLSLVLFITIETYFSYFRCVLIPLLVCYMLPPDFSKKHNP